MRCSSADGGLVAEFVDDRVTATDARTGVVRTWREWEIELGPAASADPRAFFAAVDDSGARRRRPGRGIRFEARPRARLLTGVTLAVDLLAPARTRHVGNGLIRDRPRAAEG